MLPARSELSQLFSKGVITTMSNVFRKPSKGNVYHIFARGVGRRIVFEDEADFTCFMDLMDRYKTDAIRIFAWCLMDNHFHLLLEGSLEDIGCYLQKVQSMYARVYNSRYGHSGHVFQGRFGSRPVETDEQLMIVVRYIHENPAAARIGETAGYAWSSYQEYMGSPYLCDTSFVLGICGSQKAFRLFHEGPQPELPKSCCFDDEDESGEGSRGSSALPDGYAMQVAEEALGARWRLLSEGTSKDARNEALRALHLAGLTYRQIERLTGIGVGIIARACSKGQRNVVA